MARNLARKILMSHLISGDTVPGRRIGLSVDQALLQDATGTMVWLQFEAMGMDRVRLPLVVSYVDHNTLQTGPENAEDHRYIQTAASRYGAVFCRPGMGICHQVHLERFAAPGRVLIGSDSHTPNAGGAGSLAFGSGGLEVAVAMGGGGYHLPMPKIVRVELKGSLKGWASAKEVALELLRRLSVKGGVGRIMEFAGEGVAALSVPERAAICNLCVELGATSSIFPSDGVTRAFLEKQGRPDVFVPLAADEGASYEEEMFVDLSRLEPLIACPSSPDKVVRAREVSGAPVRQVCIGSCNNSSVMDLETAAAILKDRRVHPDVSLSVSPGSRQVMSQIEKSGALGILIRAGARILESSCGPCIGMGQAPARGSISVRTFNRNFSGRSGTQDDKVYLASPAVAAASAVAGRLSEPGQLGIKPVEIAEPAEMEHDESFLVKPPADSSRIMVERGPNIAPLGIFDALPDSLSGPVLLKAGDNVTTDDILPGGAKVLPYRSNIPKIARFTFEKIDPTFHDRAKKAGGGFIVGGENYGQGSSREHAAIVVRHLGVMMVLARGFARIHRANLIAQGVIPLAVEDLKFLSLLDVGAGLSVKHLRKSMSGQEPFIIEHAESGARCELHPRFEPEEREILLAGGLLNVVKGRTGRTQE